MNDSRTYIDDARLSENVVNVLRNTYICLTATLLTSVLAAMSAMAMNAAPMGFMGIIAVFAVMFGIYMTKDSVWSLPLLFLFTGLFGWYTGPLVNLFMEIANGPEMVLTSLGLTAAIFGSLSMYVIVTKRDFTMIGGFLFAALLSVIVLLILNIFMGIELLSLALSGAVVLIMAGCILHDTSRIIEGQEDNYVIATLGLYLSILNLFVYILNILGILND